MNRDISFLERLLDAPGPSGFEVRAARVWRQEADTFAEDVRTDVSGNSFATVNAGGAPKVMLAGHIDEIGLQITHIDEEGFLYVAEIGGWDPQVLVGQRVSVLSRSGDVPGVIGKKAIHLIEDDDRSKASKIRQLWVDVGARDRDAAAKLGIRVGDPMVIAQGMVRLAEDRIASRAIDDRVGAFVVLEAIRLLSTEPEGLKAAATAVATVQEEIGYQGGGARTSAYTIDPDIAIVVDVTFSTDVPDIEKKELGEHLIGGGPVLARGSAAHPVVFERLVEAAEAAGIPHTIQAQPKATRTDADAIFLSRAGVPTGLISIPNRYMHSPNELVSLADVRHAVDLIAEFVKRLEPGVDLTPR
jgi:endoglucanase